MPSMMPLVIVSSSVLSPQCDSAACAVSRSLSSSMAIACGVRLSSCPLGVRILFFGVPCVVSPAFIALSFGRVHSLCDFMSYFFALFFLSRSLDPYDLLDCSSSILFTS